MKVLRILGISFLGLFLGVCIFGMVRMNQKYPKPVEHTYSVGDTFTFQSYEITVEDCKVMKTTSFWEEYGFKGDKGLMDRENVYCFMVSLNVKNIGEEVANPELYQIYLGTNLSTTGIDPEYFKLLNGESGASANPSLKPGESVSVILPYDLYGSSIGCMEGNPVETVPVELTLALYPEKYVVKLNDVS